MDLHSPTLRHRTTTQVADTSEQIKMPSDGKDISERDLKKGPLGRTPAGTAFIVPETQDMVSTLLLPTKRKSLGDIAIIGILCMHVIALAWLPKRACVPLFAFVYLFWRTSYNLGIGYLLYEQSRDRRLVRWTERLALYRNESNGEAGGRICRLIREELQTKVPANYKLKEAPLELITWLLFRRLTDLILMSDFISYCCFAVAASNNPPAGESLGVSILRWTSGIGLVLLNLWVKLDAHRVVKDYAWYWGDFFFLIEQQLTFDGVFEMAPHPMYSVGYAGYYGISLMAASYKVLFISILAHAAQFAFLTWVENPHIDKTYNVPLANKRLSAVPSAQEMSTPTWSSSADGSSQAAGMAVGDTKAPQARKIIGLGNLDLFRLTDTTTILLQAYLLLLTLMTPSTFGYRMVFFLNAAVWRLWYSIGIGVILNRQSAKKSWTRHFVKYGESIGEAWRQWQGLYHISMHMTYGGFIAAAWKAYEKPKDWNSDMALLSHVVGFSLILLQVWTVMSIYDSLGEFGWFFGDFFFDNVPKLTYSGIYRFLNNPERVIGLAGLWGTVLITKSKAIFLLSLLSHILSLLFIHFVERPHMQKLYGQSLREDSGLSRSLRKSLPSTLWKLQGSVDRMFEESYEFFEEIIDGARPRIAAGFHTFVKDSGSLFKHPARVTVTRLDPDVAGYDPKDYSLKIIGSVPERDQEPLCFAYGEPIRVKWTAPLNHSAKDWVGLYRVADNASWTVTRASSAGRWICTTPESYDNAKAGQGVISSDHLEAGSGRRDGETKDYLSGEVEFSGDKMFWTEGVFEVRYHHNGKYNVMAISRAFEVQIDRFGGDEFEITDNGLVRSAIEQALLPVVRNCLDRDPEIAPCDATQGYGMAVASDPKYSERVVYAVSRAFGIEFAKEVVQADGNVKNLAWRIYNAKKVLVSLRWIERTNRSALPQR